MERKKTRSRPFIIPPIFLLILVCFCQWLYAGGLCEFRLLGKTCSIAANSTPRISYFFCVAALEGVRESCHAGLNGLVIISAKLALLNAARIRHCIRELKAQANDSHTNYALDQCLQLYSDAISNVEESILAFEFSSYQDANGYLSAVTTDSEACEGWFEDLHLVFPLKESKDFMQLCTLL